jgi:hypothetical protein
MLAAGSEELLSALALAGNNSPSKKSLNNSSKGLFTGLLGLDLISDIMLVFMGYDYPLTIYRPVPFS